MATRKQDDAWRRRFDEDDGQFPQSWVPSIGDQIVGTVERYSEGTTSYGESPIVVIRSEDDDTEYSVWLLHQVLLMEFKRQTPKIGERIAIKRLADGKSAAGSGYKKYILRIDRAGDPDAVPNFDRYLAGPGAVPVDHSQPQSPLEPDKDDGLPF